jgi:hypothetical protein
MVVILISELEIIEHRASRGFRRISRDFRIASIPFRRFVIILPRDHQSRSDAVESASRHRVASLTA